MLSTQSATPEELSEQFQPTIRPFAVWYNPDPDCDSRKWNVNDRGGDSACEFDDMATALKTAATWCSEAGWDVEASKQAQALANLTDTNTEKVYVDMANMADIMQAIQTLVPHIPKDAIAETCTGVIPVCVTLEALVDQANKMVLQLLEGAEHA